MIYENNHKSIDDFDSFITHLHRRADLEKAKESGIEAYNAEQIEKAAILNILLSEYNAGRQKTMFCVAVNLLDLQDLREVIKEIEKKQDDMEIWTLIELSCSFYIRYRYQCTYILHAITPIQHFSIPYLVQIALTSLFLTQLQINVFLCRRLLK